MKLDEYSLYYTERASMRDEILNLINEAPPSCIDIHGYGRWIFKDDRECCSFCGGVGQTVDYFDDFASSGRFCPHCGAQMDTF